MADENMTRNGASVQGLVYGLTSEADEMRIRYIGFTTRTLKQRLKSHRGTMKRVLLPVSVWTAEREASGHRVVAVLLKDDATRSDEHAIIARFLAEGADLLNLCGGGIPSPHKGTTRVFTEEHRANQRAAMGRRSYAELHARLAALYADPVAHQAQRDAIRAGHAKRTPEQKAETVRKTQASRAAWSPEQKAENGRRLGEGLTADPKKNRVRADRIKAGHAKHTPEQKAEHVAKAREGRAQRSPEQNAETTRKRLATFHATIAKRRAAKVSTK